MGGENGDDVDKWQPIKAKVSARRLPEARPEFSLFFHFRVSGKHYVTQSNRARSLYDRFFSAMRRPVQQTFLGAVRISVSTIEVVFAKGADKESIEAPESPPLICRIFHTTSGAVIVRHSRITRDLPSRMEVNIRVIPSP